MKPLLPIIALALALVSDAQAQEAAEPPEELEQYRQAFEKAVATRSAPARAAFAEALQKLAQSRAATGDYAGAIRARDRRAILLGEADTATDAGGGSAKAVEGEIIVRPEAARRSGSGARLDTKGNKLIGFKEGRSLRWDLNKTEAVEYNVLVTYSCGRPTGGDKKSTRINTGGIFTLEEEIDLTTEDREPLRRTVVSTGDWNKTVTRNIGRIKVNASRMTLKLTAQKVAAGGLMHLYGIRLIPVREGAGTGDGSDGTIVGTSEPEELVKLRAQFRKAIEGKVTPLVTAYGMKLRELREQFTSSNDLDAAFEAQKAFLEAENLSRNPLEIINGRQP